MINVLKGYAGQGVGRTLMETVEEHWRETGVEVALLWVLTQNERARSFYARLGWLPDGTAREHEIAGAAISELRLCRRLR